ncbi:MAG: hypothetical protein IT179_01645 [Acidobacteria bacterium]|nr:hypothetical protein [Acidobacteriota bacterium]
MAHRGPVFEMADALADGANAGEVYVSRTGVDLLPGSGPGADDRGVMRVGAPARDVPVLALVAG